MYAEVKNVENKEHYTDIAVLYMGFLLAVPLLLRNEKVY